MIVLQARKREREKTMTTTTTTTTTFAVGDRVHFDIGSDVYPGTVVKTTATTVTVRRDTYHVDPTWKPEWIPGGFAGHVTNNREQRQIVEEDLDGEQWTFTKKMPPKRIRDFHQYTPRQLEQRTRYTLRGTDWRTGPMLRHGWRAFRDYNF